MIIKLLFLLQFKNLNLNLNKNIKFFWKINYFFYAIIEI
jgi:hypothetical protein